MLFAHAILAFAVTAMAAEGSHAEPGQRMPARFRRWNLGNMKFGFAKREDDEGALPLVGTDYNDKKPANG